MPWTAGARLGPRHMLRAWPKVPLRDSCKRQYGHAPPRRYATAPRPMHAPRPKRSQPILCQRHPTSPNCALTLAPTRSTSCRPGRPVDAKRGMLGSIRVRVRVTHGGTLTGQAPSGAVGRDVEVGREGVVRRRDLVRAHDQADARQPRLGLEGVEAVHGVAAELHQRVLLRARVGVTPHSLRN